VRTTPATPAASPAAPTPRFIDRAFSVLAPSPGPARDRLERRARPLRQRRDLDPILRKLQPMILWY
jgi:hypothetical protein